MTLMMTDGLAFHQPGNDYDDDDDNYDDDDDDDDDGTIRLYISGRVSRSLVYFSSITLVFF